MARKGKKLQVIGLHGNEAQRENSAEALQDDKRIEFHNFANGDVIEMKPGYSKVIKHIGIEEQRFLGLVRAQGSGQIVLKSMNGLYRETDREDAVFSVLSPTGERVSLRQENMLEAAQKLEDETPAREGFVQKHNYGKRGAGKVISSGKNAGKQKLGKKDNSGKKSRQQKKKEQQEQRRLARDLKKNGYLR